MPPSCSNPAAPAACTPVDVPTGWDPRTYQKPTGLLIAPPAARPVLFQIPLRRLKKTSTQSVLVFLVGAAGFEPTASSSRTRRATNCAMPRKYRSRLGCGLVGDERIELPQVESESTALPLCKSPLFGFALSTEALLTRNIIQPPPPFVNHFFDFSVHVFSAFSTTAFSRLFSSPALDTRSLWEYSYSIIYLPLLRENGRNEGCSI